MTDMRRFIDIIRKTINQCPIFEEPIMEAATAIKWVDHQNYRCAYFKVEKQEYIAVFKGDTGVPKKMSSCTFAFFAIIDGKPRVDVTETGNSTTVVRTIKTIIETFITTVKPQTIRFTASDDAHLKLYNFLARAIQPPENYQMTNMLGSYFEIYWRPSPAWIAKHIG